MQQIAQFFKVSEEQFVRDWCTATRRSADEAKKVYQNIRLPRRATKGSAGYDFFAPARDHPYSDRYPRYDRGRLGAEPVPAFRSGISSPSAA